MGEQASSLALSRRLDSETARPASPPLVGDALVRRLSGRDSPTREPAIGDHLSPNRGGSPADPSGGETVLEVWSDSLTFRSDFRVCWERTS